MSSFSLHERHLGMMRRSTFIIFKDEPSLSETRAARLIPLIMFASRSSVCITADGDVVSAMVSLKGDVGF